MATEISDDQREILTFIGHDGAPDTAVETHCGERRPDALARLITFGLIQEERQALYGSTPGVAAQGWYSIYHLTLAGRVAIGLDASRAAGA